LLSIEYVYTVLN